MDETTILKYFDENYPEISPLDLDTSCLINKDGDGFMFFPPLINHPDYHEFMYTYRHPCNAPDEVIIDDIKEK